MICLVSLGWEIAELGFGSRSEWLQAPWAFLVPSDAFLFHIEKGKRKRKEEEDG